MIARRLFLISVATATLGGCGGAGELDRLTAGEGGRVVDVRAGDAFTLDSGLVVRLAGVEAPHGSDPGAEAARDALARLVMGQTVHLFYGGARRDRYGRAIAQVRTDRHRTWVQRALLDAGDVRVHTWPDNSALAGAMLGMEARARQASRGLWTMPAYRVLLPSEAAGGHGFAVMEGRVARVTESRGATWLDFTEGGAAVVIRSHALADFRVAGVDFKTLSGAIIRTRGWVSGGVLELDHPAALERLKS